MPDDAATRDHWPRFELVTFSEPTGIPHGWDAELLGRGVPKSMLGRYEAANELALLDAPRNGQLVCFGSCGRFVKVCLNPHTGAVVDIAYEPSGTPTLQRGVYGLPRLVNSSLEQFIASIHAVLKRFPFDSGDIGDNPARNELADEWAHVDKLEYEWDQAAGELTETLHRIDAAAVANENTFWRTFIDDVQMGGFSTEMVLHTSDL